MSYPTFLTRVDGDGVPLDIRYADWALTPLRRWFEGRTYYVCRNEAGSPSHALAWRVTAQGVQKIAKQAFLILAAVVAVAATTFFVSRNFEWLALRATQSIVTHQVLITSLLYAYTAWELTFILLNIFFSILILLPSILNERSWNTIRHDLTEIISFFSSFSPTIFILSLAIEYLKIIILTPIGLIRKALFQQNGVRENYQFALEQERNGILINAERISDRPICIEPTQEELQAIAGIQLEDLVPLCNLLNSEQKQTLQNWLNKIQRADITYVDSPFAASQQMQTQLKLIILEVQNAHVTDTVLNTIISEMLNGAHMCGPRQMAEVEEAYLKIKKMTVEERILKHIQGIKKEMIIDYFSYSFHTVHSLNEVISDMGNELGLNSAGVNNDEIAGAHLSSSKKREIREHIYHGFSFDTLALQLQARLNAENEGMYDQEIGLYLGHHIADPVAREQGIDTDSDEYDRATFVLNTFFEDNESRYSIKINALQQILRQMNFAYTPQTRNV